MQAGPPSEPQRLEDVDPAVLAEIEAEFASITQEIQRISAMPGGATPRKAEILTSMRADWKQRAENRPADRPDWRKRLDAALDAAVDKLLVDSLVEHPGGGVGFELKNESLASEAPPVLKALLEGVFAMWQEKLKPAPGQPPSPFAGILASLGTMLGQAFAKAEVGTATKPAGAGEGQPEAGKDLLFEQPLEARVVLKTGEDPKVELGAPKPPEATATEATDPAATAPTPPPPQNDAGREFFAQLVGGLGQLLQRSLAPKPPASPAPTPAPEPASPSTPASTPTSTPEPAPPLTATLDVKQPDAPADPAPGPTPTVKIDLQGLLGQLFASFKPPDK